MWGIHVYSGPSHPHSWSHTWPINAAIQDVLQWFTACMKCPISSSLPSSWHASHLLLLCKGLQENLACKMLSIAETLPMSTPWPYLTALQRGRDVTSSPRFKSPRQSSSSTLTTIRIDILPPQLLPTYFLLLSDVSVQTASNTSMQAGN